MAETFPRRYPCSAKTSVAEARIDSRRWAALNRTRVATGSGWVTPAF